jgi:hypothetical protein
MREILFERMRDKSLSLCVFLLFFSFTPFSIAQETICAIVKIEIPQELTIERQAFEATLKIENTLADKTIENINVVVEFKNEFDEAGLARNDPNHSTAKFFIRVDALEGINDVSGNGSLAGGQVANVTWLIIPAPGASDGLPSGKLYFVGATFNYTLDGTPGAIEVAPDTIYVKPLPLLTLDYFLPRDVFADNPLTVDVVEPSEPFTLGVRVQNNGTGIGKSIKIESAQPEIVENDQGLLIDFTLLNSYVQNEPVNNSLLITFGDIPSNESKIGRWSMQTSLSGRFAEFTAEYSHADELGGALTSLLEAANTHTLVRDVLVDITGRDDVKDFLAYEAADTLNNSLEGLKVYESNSTETDVINQSSNATFSNVINSGVLSFSPTPGFVYAQLDDPFNGNKIVQRAVRSDGKEISLDNVWFSKSYNRTTKTVSHHLNIFDANTSGQYNIDLAEPEVIPRSPVLQFIALTTTYEGRSVGFLVEASDPDETIPLLLANGLPEGANFVDQGNGTGVFSWTPQIGQADRYEFQIVASDGELAANRTVTIVVNSELDTDGDGLLDSWELEHFGDLSRDGSADSDGDSVLDRDEEKNGTDPLVSDLAIMMAPINGATLIADSVEFTWNDVDADAYSIDVGTVQGGNNLLSSLSLIDTALVVKNLPVDGGVFYVRLWTMLGDTKGYNDYAYTALLSPQLKAEILTPSNDSQLASSAAEFIWNNVNADEYQLDIGTSFGAKDVYQQSLVGSSLTVSDLPEDGSRLYVRLWTIVNGDNGYEAYNDYIYTAHLKAFEKAGMVLPLNNSTLTGDSVTFEWSDALSDEYYIEIGTSQGENQLFSGSAGNNTELTITQLPVNGSKLYLRLWTIVDGVEAYNDYIYTTHKIDAGQAQILQPQPNSTFSSRSSTFSWEDVGADQYYLRVGSTIGTSDVFYGSTGLETEKELLNLPFDGRELFVDIWSRINSKWYVNSYVYTAYTDEILTAQIVSPLSDDTFHSRTVNFVWEDASANEYFLRIGSTVGTSDLFYGSMGTETQKTVANLPFDGRKIYVRLYTKDYGSWRYNDYVYNAFNDEIITAEMVSPQNNSTFTSTSVNFTWEDSAADQYYLRIGTELGSSDLYYGSMGTAAQKTITNLPFDGRKIYVRLRTKEYGSWRYNDYVYNAFNDTTLIANMQSPQNGGQFSSRRVDFVWDDAAADEYLLRIGSSVGESDIFYGSMGTETQKTMTHLPFDGREVYVRLFTKDYGSWRYNDYVYSAFNDTTLTANMQSPQSGEQFSSISVNFVWDNVNAADEYSLRIGSEVGGYDLFNGSLDTFNQQTVTMPSDGRNVYVRLGTKKYQTWRYVNYVYSAVDEN